MKRDYYLYCHYYISPDIPFYIGYGHKRIGNEYTKYRRASELHIHGGWDEYVKRNGDDWKYKILIDNLTFGEANTEEKEYIKFYGRLDKGTGILCNKTDGGSNSGPGEKSALQKGIGGMSGKKHKEITKLNWSIKRTGRKVSEETKEKNRIASTGKHCSDKTKELLRKMKTGVPCHTEEQKLKWSINKKGKKVEQYIKDKISKTLTGKKKIEKYEGSYRNAALNRPKYTCPYCNKSLDLGNYTQWHGEKCRYKK